MEAVEEAIRADIEADDSGEWGDGRTGRAALDARAEHLSRTAAVAAVAPMPGPLVGDTGLDAPGLRRAIGFLSNLETLYAATDRGRHDAIFHARRGLEEALRTVDAHLASRALRPAREVAHETIFGSGNESPPFALSIDQMTLLMTRVTAAIERDRAGGRR